MRKLLFIFSFLVFIANISMAQTRFMGIQMGTKFSYFEQELKKKSFVFVEKTEDGTLLYKGEFFKEEVKLYVYLSKREKKVWRVAIRFIGKEYDNFTPKGSVEEVAILYNDLKKGLEEKYKAAVKVDDENKKYDLVWNPDNLTNIELYVLSQNVEELEYQCVNLIYTDVVVAKENEYSKFDDL